MVWPKVSRQVSGGGPSRCDSSTFTTRAWGIRGDRRRAKTRRRASHHCYTSLGRVGQRRRWVYAGLEGHFGNAACGGSGEVLFQSGHEPLHAGVEHREIAAEDIGEILQTIRSPIFGELRAGGGFRQIFNVLLGQGLHQEEREGPSLGISAVGVGREHSIG